MIATCQPMVQAVRAGLAGAEEEEMQSKGRQEVGVRSNSSSSSSKAEALGRSRAASNHDQRRGRQQHRGAQV